MRYLYIFTPPFPPVQLSHRLHGRGLTIQLVRPVAGRRRPQKTKVCANLPRRLVHAAKIQGHRLKVIALRYPCSFSARATMRVNSDRT
jgi:hypothetical protein